MPNGQPIAIEVAFTHVCDQDKIEWMSARNLTTLEIDIFIPQSTSASDVVVILNARLFGTAANSRWLHHAGEARALAVLDEQERALREHHAKADAEHEAGEATARAKRKRTDEFVEKIRDIDYQTFRLSRDLTLRIAHSKIRVTMKGHGYFTNVAAPIKQIIRDAAKRFGGEFNREYSIWEFSLPQSRIVSLYNDLCLFIRSRLEEKPASPPEPGSPPEPTAIVVHSPLNLTHEEEELFEERAAIIENEGGLSREEAEKRAYTEVRQRRWIHFTR